MRLAEIVRVKNGQLPLPEAFARPLGLYDGSRLYQSKVKDHEQHQILTTIPQDCWRRILRVSVLLEHRAGALDVVAEAVSSLGASILVMEGYGREPDEEGWWSGIVQLPIPPSSSISEALSGAKQTIIDKLYHIYECHGDGDEFPFPKRLRPINGRLMVEQFEYGLRTRAGEAVVRVENMRLSVILDQVDEPQAREFRENSRSITVGKSIEDDNSQAIWGLLMCNTEERFLRFIRIKSPVEIRLQVVTRSEDEMHVGVGVLPNLTGILRSVKTGGAPGINIVYLFNYITERVWKNSSDSEGRRRGRQSLVERSVIKFFLESPPLWLVEETVGKIEQKWCEVFKALAHAKIDGKSIVEWDGSSMTLWHGKKLTFALNKRGEVKPERWWHRVRRKSNWGIWSLFGLAGMLATLAVILGFFSLGCAGVIVGFSSIALSLGGILLQLRRRSE